MTSEEEERRAAEEEIKRAAEQIAYIVDGRESMDRTVLDVVTDLYERARGHGIDIERHRRSRPRSLMTARIRYVFDYILHPWNDKMRQDGVKAWCIVRVVEQNQRVISRDPIALFHWDSAAEAMQEALFSGASLEIHADCEELYKLRARRQ